MALSLAALAGVAAQTTELTKIVETLRCSVVLVRGRDGHGAGVIWEPGLIVTNDHVVRGDRAIVELARHAATHQLLHRR